MGANTTSGSRNDNSTSLPRAVEGKVVRDVVANLAAKGARERTANFPDPDGQGNGERRRAG